MRKALLAWLVFLLLSAYLTRRAGSTGLLASGPVEDTAAPGGTYFIWEVEEPSGVVSLRHARLGGRELTILALNSSGLYRLVALNVRTGSEVASSTNFTCAPYGLCPIGDHLVVLAEDGLSYRLLIFNSSLGLVCSFRFDVPLEGPWTTSPDSFFILANRTLLCYSLEDMSLKWSSGFREADFLAILPVGQAILAVGHVNSTWLARWISPEDGSVILEVELGWLSWASGAALLPYNASCLLVWAWNRTVSQVRLVRLDGLKPSWAWSSGLLTYLLVVPDLDGDGAPEVLGLSASGGHTDIYIISGSSGREFFSARKDIEAISAFWSGGHRAFLLAEEGAYLVEFEFLKGEVRDLWHLPCSLACLLPDLDGDGYPELLASQGNRVLCVWGSYDEYPPVVISTWPPDGFSTSIPSVLLKAKVEDQGSGIKRVVFVVDGREVDATYDGGYYVAYVRLSEGVHKWSVKAVDKVGLSASEGPKLITVNMSFFGGPGWEDDALFFGPWAVALIALAAFVLRKKLGRPVEPSPPT